MATATKVIETAREKIGAVLRQYQLRWEDVAPDLDERLWREAAPLARKVRKELFRTRYPSLYAARAKKGTR